MRDLARLSPHAVVVEVEDEKVIYVPSTGHACRLDPIAAHVVECLAAEDSLDSLIARLVEESGAPPDQIRADVVNLIDRLMPLGVLQAAG